LETESLIVVPRIKYSITAHGQQSRLAQQQIWLVYPVQTVAKQPAVLTEMLNSLKQVTSAPYPSFPIHHTFSHTIHF